MLGEKWLMVAVRERFYIFFEAINTNRFRLILAALITKRLTSWGTGSEPFAQLTHLN